MRAELTKINSVISEHTSNLLPYQFLTAFSQLISRICHSNNEVFAVLMEIVAKVFLAYPQQAMWMMTAVSKVRHLSHIYIYKCLFIGINCLYAFFSFILVLLSDSNEQMQGDLEEGHQSE